MKKVIALLFSVFLLAGCVTFVPEYTKVSKDTYVRDGNECISYRVAVDKDMSDKDLQKVFDDVTSNDDYYLHTVFFYSNKKLAKGGDAYDVAVLEETESGTDPTLTR